VHKQFHTALLNGCGSPRLLGFHSMLYDQTYRYRRLLLQGETFLPSVVDREHSALAELCLARKSEMACETLRAHLMLTFTQTFGGTSARAPAKTGHAKDRATQRRPRTKT
jgi:GntR family carbon starvation induced transcriptional regulator